jgi:hypothetical protein
MMVSVTVIDATAKGVQVVLGSTDAPSFWLPRTHKAIIWSREPEPGETVTVKLPAWLIQKHGPLRLLRDQRSLSFAAPVELDPIKGQEPIPMTDSNDLRGALFKNDRKESDRHPDYKGDITIDGRKFWLSGWIKEGKRGKYLSLAAKPAEEQRQEQQPERTNTYAAARGREPDRQQRPAGGPTFRDDDQIPFGMEWR